MVTPLADELVQPFGEFLTLARPSLMHGKQHSYVFVNTRGDPYTSGSFTLARMSLSFLPCLTTRVGWTRNIKSIVLAACGVKMSNNMLRASFVTYLQNADITESIRASSALFMGHT